jgi:hypothetical protein
VLWLGLAAGTAITVLAVMHGIRIPGLEVVLSVLATWALLLILATVAAELVRRHHRAAARHAWRFGKRGGTITRRNTGRLASWVWSWLASKARERWRNRTTNNDADPDPETTPGRPTRRVDGQPETEADRRFFDLREAGYTGPIDQDGHAVNPPETGGSTMPDTTVTDDSAPGPSPRPTRLRTGGGAISLAWKQVVADTSDFEPEDDGHLLAWMAAEVNGMSNYAEAMTEVYETCVNSLGLDPVAMQATHDVADAAADAASAMAAARAKFASHYSEVRDFAASGGLLPFDGRWITGDGE